MSDGGVSVPARLSLRGVWKGFGETSVLRGVDLDVRRGEIVTVLGASGSGKTVLLKLMGGLLHPDAGEVCFDGRPLATMTPDAHRSMLEQVGVVFQRAALFDSLTAAENVAYGLEALSHRPSPETIATEVGWALALVGLTGQESLRPSELSGGMKTRLAFARALARRPEVMLIDDPTAGLDPILAGRTARLIGLLRRYLRITAVIATHDLKLALSLSDRLVFLEGGVVAAEGTVAAMRANPHPGLRAFLQPAPRV